MKSGCVIISFDEFRAVQLERFNRRNRFFAVLLPESGKGSLLIDDCEYTVNPGKIFFLNDHQVYNIANCEMVEGSVLLFTKLFYNHVYTGNKMIKSDRALENVPLSVDTGDHITVFKNVFEDIRQESDSSKKFRKEIASLLLKVLILKLIRSSKRRIAVSRSVDHKKQIAEDFTEMVNQDFKESKSTGHYAAKLNVTSNYLNTLVRQQTGITAGQTVKNRVILEAERLLLHSTISVREIAYELGFTDNSHFGKYFKSAKGISPMAYRESAAV